jgi:hypothetical protein
VPAPAFAAAPATAAMVPELPVPALCPLVVVEAPPELPPTLPVPDPLFAPDGLEHAATHSVSANHPNLVELLATSCFGMASS